MSATRLFPHLLVLTLALGCDAAGDPHHTMPGGKGDGPATAISANSWSPIVELRDDSDRFAAGKPAGGWYVTPIHANLLADGRVLVTGWGRRDHDHCQTGGSRRNGTSFLLDPGLVTSGSLRLNPLDEQPGTPGDVLYCAGHAPLADGRVLFTGGARYQDLGGANEMEFGLEYARLFDPAASAFARVPQQMGGGPPGNEAPKWYPTNARLPDGRLLVTGGFTRCCDGSFQNLGVQTFDPSAAGNTSPWATLVPHQSGRADMAPGLRDYTHVFVLPTPVGNADVAMMGWNGRTLLFSTQSGLPPGQRFSTRPGGQRPGGGQAWDSTAALVATGELLTIGGGNATTSHRADLYDPVADRWRSIDLGISRHNGSTVLLPDGTVLVVSGETAGQSGQIGDRRRPQILDPTTGMVTTLDPWAGDDRERGYHNLALLLKDGRVLIGGGVSTDGGIGCERPDLRIYNPPYFAGGDRPVVRANGGEPIRMTLAGPTVALGNPGVALRGTRGAALMALGAFTHAFDQNQRYVPLAVTTGTDGGVTLTPPSGAQLAPPGDYLLFLISDAGVPSEGVHVRLAAPTSDLRRTVIFIHGVTVPGQDMFVRGGIDHGYAAQHLGRTCTSDNYQCAIPIHHRNLRNATTAPWKDGDDFLDWYGAEPDQTGQSGGQSASGTPADWTTDHWRFGPPVRTVATDGYGEEALNQWGDNYWMVDVDMDCSKCVDGTWFELKSFITNGPGWEPDISQGGAPYASGNHFGRCGMINQFDRGSSAATFLPLP
jgi:hypothetical protein